jgi:hypothetical protein
LTGEQLTFVGFVPELEHKVNRRAWIPASTRSNAQREIEEELARLRDLAPGWFALARRILEDEKDKS